MVRADLWGLVRDAHHDLMRVLVAMNGVTTPRDQLLAQLDAFQLMARIHAVAEARVYEVVLAALAGADGDLALLAATMDDEHLDQLAAGDGLAVTEPGSLAWHEHVRELRGRVLQHAASSDRRLARLQERIPALVPRMAREYALASMRTLTVTPPPCTLLRPRRTRALRRTLPLPPVRASVAGCGMR